MTNYSDINCFKSEKDIQVTLKSSAQQTLYIQKIILAFKNYFIKIKYLIFFFNFKVVVKVENLGIYTLKPEISTLKLPKTRISGLAARLYFRKKMHGGQLPLYPVFGFSGWPGCRSIQIDTVLRKRCQCMLMRIKIYFLNIFNISILYAQIIIFDIIYLYYFS